MAVNGSELIDNPWTTIFSPFTDLFGPSFYLIPLTFIVIALYIKTRDVVVVSAFMIASGMLLGSGLIFANYPEMAYVYWLFAGLGLIGLIVGIFFPKK